MNAPADEIMEVQAMSVEQGTVALVARAEIDQQIATAKRYPRSIKRFMDEATAMVTLNESIARQCIYALPRDGKTIEGASARFGEVVASAWGNCRAGARIVNEGSEFITAQGVFHDLERNVAITYEVQRRITDKNGRKYKPDMIGVTANAACSIALRNSILKGIPKAFWEPLYQKARAVVAGDLKTLANKRAEAVQQFAIFGVTEPMILAKLGRAGIADVTVDDLVTLFGLLTAIRDGDTTPEQAFADGDAAATQKPANYPDAEFDKALPGWQKLIAEGKKKPDQIIAMAETKHPLTDEQKARIRNNSARSADVSAQGTGGGGAAPSNPGITFESVKAKLESADAPDVLDVAADLIGEVSDPEKRAELSALYTQRKKALSA